MFKRVYHKSEMLRIGRRCIRFEMEETNCVMKRENEMIRVVDMYGDSLYRIAYLMLGKPQDAQDAVQEALLRYMEKSPDFKEHEHEKAWLLRVTANLCRDYLRFRRRHIFLNPDEIPNLCSAPESREIVKEMVMLPAKYKAVLLLFYVEGYQIKEVAGILGVTENTVKKRLQRGREALKQRIGM